MLLTGKDALKRVRELLKQMSTPENKKTVKMPIPAQTLTEDACLLIPFLERLGLKFDPNVKSEPHKIFTRLNRTKGQSVSVDEWNEVFRRFEIYAAAISVPDDHCLGIARFLQSDFLERASEIDCGPDTRLDFGTLTARLYFDVQVVHDQLTALALRLGFITNAPAFEKFCDLDDKDALTSSMSVSIGDWHPMDQNEPEILCPDVFTATGGYFLHLQYNSEQQIADRWLQESCRAVLDAAEQQSEIPEGWELGDLRQCNWPLRPLLTVPALLDWLKVSRKRFFSKRETPGQATECLLEATRDLGNARRAFSMRGLPVPKRLANKPKDLDEAERLFGLLIRRFDPATTHERSGSAAIAGLHKRRQSPPDSTLVCANDLAPFTQVQEKCIRDALREAGCEPTVLSRGKGNPHRWKYCDAVASLRTVKSGMLRDLDWPDTYDELKRLIQQRSSKNPAKKTQ